MKIDTTATVEVTCHIDLKPDEKFAYRAGWWDRPLWVNHVNITWESFRLFGHPDRGSSDLKTVHRDRFENVDFIRTDQVPNMPADLAGVIQAKMAELREAWMARTLPAGVTPTIGWEDDDEPPPLN